MHTIRRVVAIHLRLAGPAAAPLYQRVDRGVRDAIEAGTLKPGDRLPSVAELAKDLKVARLTVLKAFQALEREGLLSTEVGRGTFVAGGARRGPVAAVPEARPNVSRALRALREGYARGLQEMMRVARPPGTLELGGGVPSLDSVPDGTLERLTRDALARDPRRLYAYPGPAGLPELRDAVARTLARDGLTVGADEVVATNGTQQAVALIAAWAREHDRPVLCETPTYAGIPGAFMLMGHTVTSVPWTADGLDLGALRAAPGTRPLLYVCPDFHNPTGATMSAAARRALAAWAREADATVVEDRIFRDLRFEGTAPPPLYGLLAPGRRFLVGSVSKSFMTGLRVGVLVADRPVVDDLLPYKRSMDLGGPSLVQAVAATFLDHGYVEHLDRLRPRYRARRDAAVAALEAALPEGARFTRPEGGFQLWVTLPDGLSAIEVFLRGIERGVAVSPGPAYDVDGRYTSCFRVGFGNLPEPDVTEGIRRLGDAIRSLAGRTSAVTAAGNPV